MSKKFFYFLLALILVSSLTACKKDTQITNNNSTPSNTTAVNTNPSTTETTTSATATTGTIVPGIANPANPRSILVNAPAGADVVLPKDVPAYPNSSPKDKKITNMINIFSFTTTANINEVNNFYIEALKKEGWDRRIEQTNSAEGLFFTKPKRNVRVIAYRDGREGKTVYRLNVVDLTENVQDKVQVMDEKGGSKEVKVGNVNDAMKMPYKLPSDVPIYPDAKKKSTDNPGIWWEYKSKDPVKKIASWYDQQLKASGWGVELDTSELGDSMIIYNKTIENGDKMYVGVRINDMKKESERWITLINYPINTVIPQVKATSVIEKEQAGAAKAIKEQQRKALEAKLKAEKENKQTQVEGTPQGKAMTDAEKEQAILEQQKKLSEKLKGNKQLENKK